MIHIRRFNEELKSQTFRNAARKLKKIGHDKRAIDLEEYSKVVQREESLKTWRKVVELYSPEGKFDFILKKDNKEITEKFFLHMDFAEDQTLDSYYVDGNKFEGTLSFQIGLIPTNLEFIESIPSWYNSDYFHNGCYWVSWISLDYKSDSDGNIEIVKFNNYYENEEFPYDVDHPRSTANKLRKLFIEIFSKKVDYPSGFTDISDMEKKVYDTMNNKLNIKSYSGDCIVDFFKKVSVNTMYKP